MFPWDRCKEGGRKGRYAMVWIICQGVWHRSSG